MGFWDANKFRVAVLCTQMVQIVNMLKHPPLMGQFTYEPGRPAVIQAYKEDGLSRLQTTLTLKDCPTPSCHIASSASFASHIQVTSKTVQNSTFPPTSQQSWRTRANFH